VATRLLRRVVWWAILAGTWVSTGQTAAAARPPVPATLLVNGATGSDTAPGDRQRPLQSISAAIALLPDPLRHSVTVEWMGGDYATTGGRDMATNRLELMRRMRPGVRVTILGRPDQTGKLPILSWQEGEAMVDVREGDWWLENVQVGTGTTRQRRGLQVSGPGQLTLKNVTIRTCSFSDAGIYAHRGGTVLLRGAIRLNEHLHDRADRETFAGIIATDHGLVRFAEQKGASLDLGNGSLSASYYGVIRLGCETARITSWGEQNNCLAVNNSGRIDLHDSAVRLCARLKQNTPIGLEHDGHILAEGAHILIEGTNDHAILLQKASTLTGNAIELRGNFPHALAAYSGSMFVGRFLTDIAALQATTGASINVENVRGKITGAVTAAHGGIVCLPDRTVRSAP